MAVVCKILCTLYCLLVIEPCFCDSHTSLQLVIALFRHGDRTRDLFTYPKNPNNNETFSPFGIGQLTTTGKMKAYNLGAMLRKRYNQFLEPVYKPGDIIAASTDVSRTKCTLQLVLEGLFPSNETALNWNCDSNWNLIPFESLNPFENRILSYPHFVCPRYIETLRNFTHTKMARRLQEEYIELYPYLQDQTGLNITSLYHLYRLYDVLFCESMWGLPLPKWTKSVFPHFLKKGSIENFMLFHGNPELIQLAGGFHLKKIISDMYNSLEKSQPRMYLYSAHDMNIVNLLYALNVFFPHLPPYAACVIIELHKVNNIPVVKIFYEDYTLKNDIKQLVVGNCTAECPLEEFVDLLKNNIPDTSNGDPCILNENYLYPIIV